MTIEFGECGAKGSIIKPPYSAFFKASCALHDESYYIGHTEEDRIKADIGFFRAMLVDCQRLTGLQKQKYVIWAHIYFIAVRAFGWKYFYYAHEYRKL